MTRARALWLAGGVVVLACLGYLVRRRRARVPAVTTVAPARELATAGVTGRSASEVALVAEPSAIEQPAQVPADDAVPVAEQPLPSWARAAIVFAALVAFFAVSLIATKHV